MIEQKSDSGLRDFSLSEILADGELCAEIEKWSPPTFVKRVRRCSGKGKPPATLSL